MKTHFIEVGKIPETSVNEAIINVNIKTLLCLLLGDCKTNYKFAMLKLRLMFLQREFDFDTQIEWIAANLKLPADWENQMNISIADIPPVEDPTWDIGQNLFTGVNRPTSFNPYKLLEMAKQLHQLEGGASVKNGHESLEYLSDGLYDPRADDSGTEVISLAGHLKARIHDCLGLSELFWIKGSLPSLPAKIQTSLYGYLFPAWPDTRFEQDGKISVPCVSMDDKPAVIQVLDLGKSIAHNVLTFMVPEEATSVSAGADEWQNRSSMTYAVRVP